MTRPTYQTPEHLGAEQELIKKLVGKLGFAAIHKIPKQFYPVDFAGVSTGGFVVAFMELKTRTNPHNKYSDYMIGLTKYTSGVQMAGFTGLESGKMREVEALRRCPYTGTARKSRRRTQPFSHFVPLHKLGNLLH